MTNEQHNKYLGVAFLVHGGLQVLMMLFIAIIFGGFVAMIPNQPGGDEPPRAFFAVVMGFVMMVQAVFAAPSFVAAYALLKRKSWARLGAIIAAVLSAMNVPIGTAVCVYALWFFCGENWKEVYQPATARLGGAGAQLPGQAGSAAWTVNQGRESSKDYAPPPPPPDWR